jgi:YbgC/YbaW family acyl-CoA thioester hydrolase
MHAPGPFHFTFHRLVEFSDTDLAGIMHFANFLRFVETAEHAFFRSLGFRVHSATAHGQEGWPRLEVSCKFLKPARFEETLEICLRIEEIRTSTLRYSFAIFTAGDASRSPLATGSCAIIHVALDAQGHNMRKTPIPPELRQRLESAVAAATPRN